MTLQEKVTALKVLPDEEFDALHQMIHRMLIDHDEKYNYWKGSNGWSTLELALHRISDAPLGGTDSRSASTSPQMKPYTEDMWLLGAACALEETYRDPDKNPVNDLACSWTARVLATSENYSTAYTAITARNDELAAERAAKTTAKETFGTKALIEHLAKDESLPAEPTGLAWQLAKLLPSSNQR